MTLEQKVERKIAQCAPHFNALPGIVIIHHLHDRTVRFMSDNGLSALGISMQELTEMGPDYHERYFNQEEAKDYIPKITGMLERNNDEEYISFFQEVKTCASRGWSLYLSTVQIFMRDDDGHPLLLISNSIPVDPEHNFYSKVERLLEENHFLRQNTARFASLSKREMEILKLAAMGRNNASIATQLFLSEETVKTHRKNIRKKLDIHTPNELLKFVHAFDLV